MFGDALRKLRESLDMTRDEFAAQLGISSNSLKAYELGKRRPDFEAALKIESEFKVTIYELNYGHPLVENDIIPRMMSKYGASAAYLKKMLDYFYEANEQSREIALYALKAGRSESFGDGSSSNSKNVIADTRSSCDNTIMLNLPVMGRSAAGRPIEMVSIPEDPVSINGEAQVKAGDFIVIAVGDSMIEAGIHDGDKCVIRPQDWVENGEIALIAVTDGSTIKKFFKDDDGFRLVPCNPAYPIQRYSSDAPIRVLGRFIAVVK